MAKQINTRILLKYDSYTNWEASEFILKKGEAAVCEMSNTVDTSGDPTILVKYGNGEDKFADLPWTSALAADVYAWAKESGIHIETGNTTGTSASNGALKVVTGLRWVATDAHPNGALVVDYAYAAQKSDITTALGDYATKAYADQAEADAISTAAGDATTKANKALADAKTYADTAEADAIATAKDYTDAEIEKITTGAGYATTNYVDQAEADAIAAAKAYADANDADTTYTFATGTANGTITVTPKGGTAQAVSVYGLKSAAYTESSAYATAAQGTTADSTAATIAGYGNIVTHNVAEFEQAGVAATKAGEALEDAKDYTDAEIIGLDLALSGNTINLTNKAGTVVASLDASNFVKDGMLQSVTYDEADNALTFTWNTSAGITATTIQLDDLVDTYTGVTGSKVNVSVSGNAISADIVAGSIAKADLATAVQTSLGKADSAVQSVKVLGETLSNGGELTVDEAKTALGLGSAAYTASTAYATAAQGTKADNAVPNTTTINGHALNANITLDATDVGAATAADITTAINALDVSNISGFGAGKTLKTLTETDGKIAATFQDISITASQVSDFSTKVAAVKVASATAADKATQDASGNVITSTYATKTEVSAISTKVGALTTDDIDGGTETWIFNCGDALNNIN